MTSLFLLPIVYLILNGNRKKSNTKSLPSNSGLLFSCSKIEIFDKSSAYSKINSLIEEFSKTKSIKYSDISLPQLFEFIVKKLNLTCYNKMIARKLSQQEKIVVALLFIIIFNRYLTFVEYEDEEDFLKYYQEVESNTILHIIGLTQDDKDDIDAINEDFKKTYKYP